MKVSKLFPVLLALSLASPGAAPAADFFGIPEKTVVPKPPAATPAPATTPPAATENVHPVPPPGSGLAMPVQITGAPVNEEAPTLLPDGAQLKTPSVGGQRDLGRPFRDLGPENGILLGFEYTLGTSEQGATVVESFTPLYLRAAGKARGTLRGTPKPGNPATVLEARPGFAVAGMEVCGSVTLDAFRITFMRYENGTLDLGERYTTKWIGNEKGAVTKSLRTDTRPIVGVYGKAGLQIHEFGLLVRKEAALVALAPPKSTPFGTPGNPDTAAIPPTTPEMPEIPEQAAPAAAQLEPTPFDPAILQTDAIGKGKGKGTPFRDLAPAASLLIGFDYAVIRTSGQKIGSLRPLYLLGNGGKKLGDAHGDAPTDVRVDARPGYAVGAITARGDFMLRGFQLTFMRIKGAGLDPADSYQSDWIGGKVGPTKNFDGAGQPIVGLYGKTGDNIEELGAFVRKTGAVASVPPGVPALSTSGLTTGGLTTGTPAPPTGGNIQIFACADDEFTLFLNGRQILSGSNVRNVETGSFAIVKGDVLTAVVTDKGGGGDGAWFSLRVVRDGKTILDAGDMRYLTSETLNWQTTKLVSNFREPKVWTHEKKMGTDARPRAAWASAKDANATTLYFKGVVP